MVPKEADTIKAVPQEAEKSDRIGRYKLLEKVGEGGFGVVYVAEQREPVKRKVALKIIKLGMDTRQVQARATLAKGVEIATTKLPKLESGDLSEKWAQWLIAHALMREAKALIESGSKTSGETGPRTGD